MQYNFIEYNHDSSYQETEEAILELTNLLKNSIFITFNGLPMFDIADIKDIGSSLRGVTLNFNDGLFTYGYNVTGGYQISQDN